MIEYLMSYLRKAHDQKSSATHPIKTSDIHKTYTTHSERIMDIIRRATEPLFAMEREKPRYDVGKTSTELAERRLLELAFPFYRTVRLQNEDPLAAASQVKQRLDPEPKKHYQDYGAMYRRYANLAMGIYTKAKQAAISYIVTPATNVVNKISADVSDISRTGYLVLAPVYSTKKIGAATAQNRPRQATLDDLVIRNMAQLPLAA